MSILLFPIRELHSVTISELKCLYAMVHKIRYSSVADYFKEIQTLVGPIECTSMVTQMALNLGCSEMALTSYIEGDVPTLGLDHFVHVHILCEEPNYSISLLYAGGSKALWLPDLTLALYSCHQLTLQLTWMGDAHHSYSRPPHTRQRARMEATQVTPGFKAKPNAHSMCAQ
jgi:hypothetical protein